MRTLLICILTLAIMTTLAAAQTAKHTFSIGDSNFLLDGKPFQIIAGEMHPGRIPHEYWRQRLKMARAMGLNTVSIYIFWNQLEPRPGAFNFKGDGDMAQFVRIAQEEGLYVMVRPGPYVCAEWDFGGYPWWLLKQHDLKVRSQDPRFLAACENYFKHLAEQLAPLQITRGGPIIMMQVENEYGSYAGDHVYMGKIRDMEHAAGFDVHQFTADGGGHLMANGSLPDVLPGLNGGSGPGLMKEINKYRPNGPYLVPEFYPGWLDHWGEPHARTGIPGLVHETDWKLSNNVSFCYYMVHGGTNFGFMNGANYGGRYQPQPTSYDYDAPIDEAGRPTKKYFALRDVIAKHLPAGETLPDVPASNPIIPIPPVELTEAVSLFDILGKPIASDKPLSMEDIDQGYGYILYRTKLKDAVKGTLTIKDVRDYALVYVNGKYIATLDRRHKADSVALDVTEPGATLDILIENCGRINYGGQIPDNRKGITNKVVLGGEELTGWQIFSLPMDHPPAGFKTEPVATTPVLRCGTFNLAKTGDTFLDMRGWGKGIVFINGHNLGRYWYIGPQQTLYVPGCWLKEGANEVVVFEMLRDTPHSVSGLTEPILNQLNPEEKTPNAPPTAPRAKGTAPKLQDADLINKGQFADSPAAQDVKFAPIKGRYICLQSLSSQKNDEFASVAELAVLDTQGKPLPRDHWKVVYVDSEETLAEDGNADNAFDGNSETKWHSIWSAPHTSHPHTLVIDMGASYEISGLRYQGRQDENPGRIKDYKFYVRSKPF